MTGIAAGVAVLAGAGLGRWGVVAVAMVVLASVLARWERGLLTTGAVVLLAAMLGAWRSSGADSPVAAPGDTLFESVIVVTNPVRDGQFQHFSVELDASENGQSKATAPRGCVTANAVPTVRLGDHLELSGRARAAVDLGARARGFLTAQRCSSSLFATTTRIIDSSSSLERSFADLRTDISNVLRRAAPGDAGVLLSGLVTGDDAGFSDERYDAFVGSATRHLTAVSGSNLALVAGIFAAMGAATVGRHRLVWQAATIGAVWGYAFLSGLQSPAIRAAIVASAAILAFRIGRRPDFATLIMLAAGVMVLVEPAQISSLGFRLSVAASLALAAILPAHVERGRLAALTGMVTATTAAQVATLPFLMPVFGTVSLFGLPANIIAAPLVAVAMPIAFCAGFVGLFSMPVAEILAAPAALAASALLAVVDRLGTPSSYVRLGTPPIGTALAIGVTCACLLLAVSVDLRTVFDTAVGAIRTSGEPNTSTDGLVEIASTGSTDASRLGESGVAEHLVATARPMLSGKDPTDTLACDPNNAIHHPSGEEDGHQVAEERQG